MQIDLCSGNYLGYQSLRARRAAAVEYEHFLMQNKSSTTENSSQTSLGQVLIC